MNPRGWHSVVAGTLAGAIACAAVPDAMLFVAGEATRQQATDGERYACPMMDFIGRKPGPCPVCGMDMARIESGALTREQQRRMGVRTVQAIAGPVELTVHAYGSAQYDLRAGQAVVARIGGRVVRRHGALAGGAADLGAGEPLIDVFNPEIGQVQAELAAALAVGDHGTATAVERRLARWDLQHVAAAVRGGAAPSDTVTLRSPSAGRAWLDDQDALNATLAIGAEIAPGTPLLTLVDPAQLTLVFHVPEGRVHLLRPGQRVLLASDDLGELPEVDAVVGRVADRIDAQIRSREVRVHLGGQTGRILPGSLLRGRIRVALGADLGPAEPGAAAQLVTIPKTAVLATGVRQVAWKVAERRSDGSLRFEPVSLALGPRIEDAGGADRFVVRAGLAAGDEVATEGLFLIDSQAQLAGSPSLLFPAGIQGVPAHAH